MVVWNPWLAQMRRAVVPVDIPENFGPLFDQVGIVLALRADQLCWLAVWLVTEEVADETKLSRALWTDMESQCLAMVSEGMKQP